MTYQDWVEILHEPMVPVAIGLCLFLLGLGMTSLAKRIASLIRGCPARGDD